MTTVLVAGGAGFLGANLCARLVRDSNTRVVCIDSLRTGRIESIGPLMGLDNFTFLRHNLEVPIDFAVQKIYNVACASHSGGRGARAVDFRRTCVCVTANLLDLSRRYDATMMHVSGLRADECDARAQGMRHAEALCMDMMREPGARICLARAADAHEANLADELIELMNRAPYGCAEPVCVGRAHGKPAFCAGERETRRHDAAFLA